MSMSIICNISFPHHTFFHRPGLLGFPGLIFLVKFFFKKYSSKFW